MASHYAVPLAKTVPLTRRVTREPQLPPVTDPGLIVNFIHVGNDESLVNRMEPIEDSHVVFVPDTVIAGGMRIHGIKVVCGTNEIGWVREYNKDALLELIDDYNVPRCKADIFGRIIEVESFIYNRTICYRGKIHCLANHRRYFKNSNAQIKDEMSDTFEDKNDGDAKTLGSTVKDDTQIEVESEMINDVDVSDNDSIATASDCTNVDEHNEDDCYMDTPSKPTQMRSANTPSKYKPYHNTNATPYRPFEKRFGAGKFGPDPGARGESRT